MIEKKWLKKQSSNLVHNNFNFSKFKANDKSSTIYKYLNKFFNRLNESKKAKPRKNDKKRKKVFVKETVSELYDK